MSSDLIIQPPCDRCPTKVYAGEGIYECGLPRQTCDKVEVVDWADDLASTVAKTIAKAHFIDRETRHDFALDVCTAFENLLYGVDARIDLKVFMRRCDVPLIEEVK